MLDKTINVRSIVDIEGVDVVHMNCQIGANVDNLNISIFVSNKELYEDNIELVKEKCAKFMKESLKEAVSQGWDMLKVEF